MPRVGRPPKPTALKELEGNPGRRPLNTKEPKPTPTAPKCPPWLHQDAKKEWKRMAQELERMGLLTQVDMAAFAGYCQSYARWKEAEEFISKHGSIFKTPSGYVQQIPQVAIAQQNLKQMRSFCSELGITPASRSRIAVNDTEQQGSQDAMADVLRNIPRGRDIVADLAH